MCFNNYFFGFHGQGSALVYKAFSRYNLIIAMAFSGFFSLRSIRSVGSFMRSYSSHLSSSASLNVLLNDVFATSFQLPTRIALFAPCSQKKIFSVYGFILKGRQQTFTFQWLDIIILKLIGVRNSGNIEASGHDIYQM